MVLSRGWRQRLGAWLPQHPLLTDRRQHFHMQNIASHWSVCSKTKWYSQNSLTLKGWRILSFRGTFFSTLRDYIKHLESSNQYLTVKFQVRGSFYKTREGPSSNADNPILLNPVATTEHWIASNIICYQQVGFVSLNFSKINKDKLIAH